MDYLGKYLHWRYRNTVLLACSIILLIIFADHAIIRGVIAGFTNLKYMGVFFAGMFYVSTFTIFPATILLAEMAKSYGFWETTLLATAGALLGDYLIFRFIKDTVITELAPIFEEVGQEKHLYKLFHSPLFAWALPVIGAVIIASPLPDEMGLSVLGISNMSNRKFLLLVTILDFLGMVLLVSLLKNL